MITIEKNVISGQSKGCFFCIQVRYTRILFQRFWNKRSDAQAVHLYLAAPRHSPEYGLRCSRWGVNRLCIG